MPYLHVAFNLPVDRPFTYHAPDGENDYAVGKRVEAPFRNRKLRGFIVAHTTRQAASKYDVKDITRVIDDSAWITPDLLALAHWMREFYLCSLGEALSAMLPVALGKRPQETDPPTPLSDAPLGAAEPVLPPPTITFTPAQQQVLEQYQKITSRPAAPPANAAARPPHIYLHGVTGSGKGELLLHIAHQTLNASDTGGVILLVPEISLAIQTAELIKHRFPTTPHALLHSRLTHKQRTAALRQITTRHARLVIGARSAIFAPLPDIRLIIIDEEQEGAYKSHTTPRYHARHVAFRRAAAHSASILMASATPSLEAWHAIKTSRMHHLTLAQRAIGQPPRITIAPLQGQPGIIGDKLQQAIHDTLGENQQVLLLHNRRGFGHALICRACGYTQRCTRCAIALIYHKQKASMLCHYCGERQPKQTQCPECKSIDIGFVGFGTELVEQETRRLFPDARIARVDTDTMARPGTLETLLRDVSEQKIDILVGTQMIAKGLNFRHLRLVGIILADASLTLPDFRAEEQTFILLTQVAGRASRHPDGGQVIIQTYREKNAAVTTAAAAALEEFYNRELTIRRDLAFPPYRRMIRIVIRGTSDTKVKNFAHTLHQRAASAAQSSPELSIYDPQPCSIAKISDKYRWQIIILAPDITTARAPAAHALALAPPAGVFTECDIDPLRIL